MKKYYISLLILLLPFFSFAQINKLRYGERVYDKYDYIDAQEVYKKVIDKGYGSVQIYQDLADSYYFQSNYAEAAEWYDKLFTIYKDSLSTTDYLRAIQSNKGIENYAKADQLLESYKEIYGSSNSLVKNFAEDPDYLASLKNTDADIFVKEVSVNREDISDHGAAFLGDDKVVFASASTKYAKKHSWDGMNFYDLFVADIDEETGDLINAVTLEGDVNSPYHESTAVFTKDGKTMYFTRNNEIKKKRSHDPKVMRLKIFKAELQDNGKWNVVEDLPFNDNSFSTAYPALNADETKLYFSSDRPGGQGMSDIWYVDLMGDRYGEPVHLGNEINTPGREAFLFISEKDILYFASDGHLGLGGLDIYYTELDENGKPGEITNLGEPFNSSLDDFSLIVDADGKKGYFTSNRGGVNAADDDIFHFNSDRPIDSAECEILLAGVVKDQDTQELLAGALVELFDESNNKIAEQIVGEDAAFAFDVDCGTQYLVKGFRNGYSANEYVLETPTKSGTITQDIELTQDDDPCPADDLGCRLALQPIYFDFDKHFIRPDAEIEISKVLAAMEMYPDLTIHIESHTDSRGSHAYNEALSDRRAKSTREWLINNGISADRLTAKGYGETQLVNECADGVPCTVEQHQLNRRSMFIITSPDVILKKK